MSHPKTFSTKPIVAFCNRTTRFFLTITQKLIQDVQLTSFGLKRKFCIFSHDIYIHYIVIHLPYRASRNVCLRIKKGKNEKKKAGFFFARER